MTKPEDYNRIINSYITLPIYIGLIFTMLINGWNFFTGDQVTFLKYLNIYNNSPLDSYPSYFSSLFYLTGIAQIISAIILIYALIKKHFLKSPSSSLLKWGILLSLFSVSIFGCMLRIISNHGGSANLYFYLCILYFLLWYTEKYASESQNTVFQQIKLFPVYFSLFYTMGLPGWQKLVNTSEVMGKYIRMFSTSFLGQLPGGVAPFIYFLGTLEIIVPILLIVSLFKGEYNPQKRSLFLNMALLISICTFIMLSFGLSVLVNYPGSTNLVFYAILSLGLYQYISYSKN
ncbi:hypothetical protein [Chryseobacterium sp.]|uniref:hypothetical protein n=1 Tax=Chryseobacterium sp. TaxID=1871047 RepID=UPI0025C05161|nr:hypothetical protein [Chryseobacterium sp.]